MTVTEGKTTGADSKKVTHFTPASSKVNNSVTRMSVSARDKNDDDPFRSKPSGVPDLRSQEDWESFLENKVRNVLF